jgi:hypothetical protein
LEVEKVEGLRALKTGVCRKGGRFEDAAAAVERGHERMLTYFGVCRKAKNGFTERRREGNSESRHAELVSASMNT